MIIFLPDYLVVFQQEYSTVITIILTTIQYTTTISPIRSAMVCAYCLGFDHLIHKIPLGMFLYQLSRIEVNLSLKN